ncbi:hypothetical protein PR048_026219 [Dryococelus australis]|uniref:HAT C-terminal dimerisation domain-containing protein n=1 Tax=Dryococelus australis TaxID=614101 RepID=A0ABQ9GKQ3_9NEOP|nr:hypothetical protein PR048_026219 [Dryococelus australis]
MNRFKSFMDKLYIIYYASPKNARQLKVCAQTLETQILKGERILSRPQFCSSDNIVAAVRQNYEAMVLHLEEAKEDRTRDKKDREMYEGLLRKISSTEFILDLELINELSDVSFDLQERNIDLYKSHSKVKDVVELFEKRKTYPGSAYRKSLEAAENLKFCGVAQHKKGRLDDPPIFPGAFYESLKNSIQKRLLCNSNVEMIRFNLYRRELIRTLREFVKSPDVMPEKLLHLNNTQHIIPVSSSECERGFSKTNIIVTPDMADLLTETIKTNHLRTFNYVNDMVASRTSLCHRHEQQIKNEG